MKYRAIMKKVMETEAVKLVKELAERDRQNRERGEQILDYYRNGQQKGVRI